MATSGSAVGGTFITVYGTNFGFTGTTVSLGGALATNVNVQSAFQLTAITTAHAPGIVNVVVTNKDGQSGTLTNGFTYQCPAVGLSPATLPNGTVGGAYSQAVTGSGGLSPYAFSLASGALPVGVALSPGGVISGTPSAAGSFIFSIRATDANGCVGTRSYTLVVVSSPTGFYTVVPCRAVDTRNAAGPYGGPALPASGTRIFPLAGQCGIPSTAKAVAVNLTVVSAAAAGNLICYPSNIAIPGTSVLNFGTGQTRANNAVTSVAQDGTAGIAIYNASAGANNLIIDVVGYFK